MEKPTIRISVRNLVEFILRRGDLEEGSGRRDPEIMQKGGRLHRKLQNQQGKDYRAEVTLKKIFEYDDLNIELEGRADGIFTDGDLSGIDEIKGLASGLDRLERPLPLHIAQARCYAAIYSEQNALEHIIVQMTYGDLETEELRIYREVRSQSLLQAWLKAVVDEYHKWASWRQAWILERNRSVMGLEFPFPYRDGQKKMVAAVYHAVSGKKQIFIKAPTGVGKTMSAIFPAVRAIGEGKADLLFYLTAKTITRTAAQEAFLILRERGLRFRSIVLTAKEKLCFQEKVQCSPRFCPYAEGHFDRVNDAVFDLLVSDRPLDRETILMHAGERRVCPFEMMLDLSLWADGIIGDYNYVFDPDASLKRFFGEGTPGRYVFLVDEAHNLPDRAREMYSAWINRQDVMDARKICRALYPKLSRYLMNVNKRLLEIEKAETDGNDRKDYRILQGVDPLILSVLSAQGEMDRILQEDRKNEFPEDLLELYFQFRTFLNVSDLADENYEIYTVKDETGKCRVRLYCVNPAQNLNLCLQKGISTVFFSATLYPMQYYRHLLSLRPDDYGVSIPSPFPQKNRCILVGTDVSSRYLRRGYQEYRRIAEYIARTVSAKKGNYMIFLPSYQFLDEVKAVYEEEFSVPWVETISQTREMNETEKEAFLKEFRKQEKTLAAFCVMGGSFSEGIDLAGEKLIGAVIAGCGLPGISSEREILKEFYEKQKGQGFAYAYRNPGMNRVLQAAGRVIRTAADVGVILLLDDRFTQEEYRTLFPPEWSDRQVCRVTNVEEKLREFWNHAASEEITD